MKSNVFAALAAVAIVALFVASVCLLGGYAAILFGSIIAAFLAGSEGQEGRTEDRTGQDPGRIRRPFDPEGLTNSPGPHRPL